MLVKKQLYWIPLLLILTGCSNVTNNIKVVQIRNMNASCIYNYPYQDFNCSPGHAFPLTTIQVNGKYVATPGGVIVGDICVSGYTKNVRDVPETEKIQVFEEYGVPSHKTGEYEVDHIISLELGGDNSIENLYPQPALPYPGFHEKDKIENLLHKMVCNNQITLQQAQYDISHNWTKYLGDIK